MTQSRTSIRSCRVKPLAFGLCGHFYKFYLLFLLSTDLLLIMGARLPGTEINTVFYTDLMINAGTLGTGLVGYITHGRPEPS